MACKVIDILTHTDMVNLGLIKTDESKHPVQALHVKDKNLMSRLKKLSRELLIYLLNCPVLQDM